MTARMRSTELDLATYPTDKLASGYLPHYDARFAPLVDEEITLLELGVNRGGSLLLWRDYFPRGRIVGVDRRLQVDLSREPRITTFEGSQDDVRLLDEIARQTAPAGFDVIVDDASHLAEPTHRAFWHLFDRHLKPGGLYVVEDWGTGYWSGWPDGASYRGGGLRPARWLRTRKRLGLVRGHRVPSHDYGMVGFLKDLVDEMGAADHTRVRPSDPPGRPSKFRELTIVGGIAFITKA